MLSTWFIRWSEFHVEVVLEIVPDAGQVILFWKSFGFGIEGEFEMARITHNLLYTNTLTVQ